MRLNNSCGTVINSAHEKAGRFYYAYYYFYARIKVNRHAMTE